MKASAPSQAEWSWQLLLTDQGLEQSGEACDQYLT